MLVVWAQNITTGKPAPIEAEINPKGNVMLFTRKSTGRKTYYRVLSGQQLEEHRAMGTPLHVNHFATCPEAKSWKKT